MYGTSNFRQSNGQVRPLNYHPAFLNIEVFLGGFKQWAAELVAGDFDAAAVDARLESEISTSPALVYSFTSCPFCKRAKELLKAKGATYTAVELDLVCSEPSNTPGRLHGTAR